MLRGARAAVIALAGRCASHAARPRDRLPLDAVRRAKRRAPRRARAGLEDRVRRPDQRCCCCGRGPPRAPGHPLDGMGPSRMSRRRCASSHAAGAGPVALLHCASIYPAELVDVNLRAIGTLRDALRRRRSASPITPSDRLRRVLAVGRGAVIIEKHLTLDRTMPGPDHAASLEPGGACQDGRRDQ